MKKGNCSWLPPFVIARVTLQLMPHALGTHCTAEELLSNDRVFLSMCKLETRQSVNQLLLATAASDDRSLIFLLYM